MNQESKFSKILLNARINLICYLLSTTILFFTRKVLIDNLGEDFLGLSSTIQSLLGFLNLVELGIGTTIATALYSPIHLNNREELKKLLSLLGYLFRYIGGIILLCSFIIILFIPLFFPNTTFSTVTILFGIISYTCSSCIWYFFSYKSILLSADQKNYIITGWYQVTNIIKSIIQVLLAIWISSYIAFFTIEILCAILNAWILHKKIISEYPWLHVTPSDGRVLIKEYSSVVKNLKQVSIHQIGSFFQNQSAPLFIYLFISLSSVTLYTNYKILTNAVSSIFNSILGSSGAAVGLVVAEGNQSRITSIFSELLSVRFFISGYVTFGVYCLVDSFIQIWLGADFILSSHITLLISLHLFLTMLRGPIDQFIAAHRLFGDIWAPVIELLIFVIFSIVGGYIWGLAGILLAPICSLTIIVHIWKPYYLYKNGFKRPIFDYFLLFTKNIIAITFAGIVGIYATNTFMREQEYSWILWGSRAIVFSVFYVISSTILLYFLSEGFRISLKRVLNYFSKMLH